MLLFVLATVVSTSAFASNDNDGKNDGIKVELKNSSNSFEINGAVPDFNLNTDVVRIVQTPECGAPEHTGWTFDHYEYNTTGVFRVDKRECIETITIYWPWGAEEYSWQTTETRSYPINVE